MDIQKAFGEELRRLRYEQGVSQETLAYEAGVDRSYVSELENGKWAPSIVVIFKLARALGVAPGDLVGRVDRRLGEEP